MKAAPEVPGPLGRMRIRASAPVRINDIGGWTDTWFSGKGRVLSLAVRPGVVISAEAFPHINPDPARVRLHIENYHESLMVNPDRPDLSRHPILQAAVGAVRVPEDLGMDIRIRTDVPPGSALGTSASVNVALLGALLGLTGRSDRSPREVAALAHRIETEDCGLQSGIQDQIAAACGGICDIDMPRYPMAEVTRLSLDPAVLDELAGRICLVYLGSAHVSSKLHERVISELEAGGAGLSWIERLRELAPAARRCLENGDLTGYGEVMIRNNECQRGLRPGLISEAADAVIAAARRHGAAGWKVNGAGGEGGSVTILGAPHSRNREKLRSAIEALGGGIRVIEAELCDSGLLVDRRTDKTGH